MPRLTSLSTTVATATLMAVAATAALGRTPDADPREVQWIDLSLRIVTEGPYLPRLPVLLETVMSNPTSRDLSVARPTLSERDNTNNTLDVLYVRGPDTAPALRTECVLANFRPMKEGLLPRPPEWLVLKPRESRTIRFTVCYDWLSSRAPQLITDVGTLRLATRLCAVVRNKDGKLAVDRQAGKTSNVVTLTVAPPKGADADAAKELFARERPWLIAAPQAAEHVTHGDDFAFFRDFIAHYPQSTYAVYVKGVLAQMTAFGDRLDLNPKRPPDPAAAQALLDEVARNPRYAVRGEAEELLRKLRERVGAGK